MHTNGAGGEGGAEAASDSSLEGTRWVLTVDVGREKNTWMPPQWAVSGMRMRIPLLVRFLPNGVLKPLAVGSYVKLKTLGDGEWRMDGSTLRCRIDISGFERGDVSLPVGPLFLGIPCWGAVLSRDKGIATIKARRCALPALSCSLRLSHMREPEGELALTYPLGLATARLDMIVHGVPAALPQVCGAAGVAHGGAHQHGAGAG